jgi:hypothetical protein
MPAKRHFSDTALIKVLEETHNLTLSAKHLGAPLSTVYSRIKRSKNPALKKVHDKIEREKDKATNLLGKRFGSRVVIEQAESGSGKMWWCLCDCGKKSKIRASFLLAGRSKTCISCIQVTHGKTNTPEYKAWQGMKDRCNNKQNAEYKNYGARGVKVCEEWKNNFETFLKHVGKRPTNKHSIDRIDNDGNYEPGNVRWATDKEQTNNRRLSVEFEGKTISCKDLGLELKLDRETVRILVNSGWDRDHMKAYKLLSHAEKKSLAVIKNRKEQEHFDNYLRKQFLFLITEKLRLDSMKKTAGLQAQPFSGRVRV